MFTTNPWIKVADVRNKELVKVLMLSVDEGEAEAIAIALRQNACLLIDDLLGRKAAKRLGLIINGTLGLFIAAKKKGIVTSVQDCIERIVEVGYYLDDELIDVVLRTAKELEETGSNKEGMLIGTYPQSPSKRADYASEDDPRRVWDSERRLSGGISGSNTSPLYAAV